MKTGSSLVPASGNEALDVRPIELQGFKLRARSARPVGRPSIVNWQAALQFAAAVHEASPYWIGDLLAYAESRDDWREKLSQAMAHTGLSEQTLHNLGYISRRIAEPERAIAPSLSHAAEVAPMDRSDQVRWLDKAKTEGWTRNELRKEIKAASRRKVIEGQAVLEGQYRVIYADPPWKYGDRPPSGSGAQDHYPGMTIEEICSLPVAAHAMPNAVLFMWVTAPFLLLNPGPREVIEAWGFEYKTGGVWDKVLSGGGHYFAIKHEHLVIATRGSCLPDRPTPSPDSVQTIRRDGEHSEKPEEYRKLIESMYDGPYLELFGRKKAKGWKVFGNDARLWGGGSGQ